MNRMFRKGMSWLLVLAMVMTMFAGTTFTASAKTEGTISAETVTAYVLAKDGITEKQLALWTADAENDTYKDTKGNEIPAVVSVKGYDNYQDGETQDYILYTGSDNGCFGRNLVVTKYVDVKELASELAKSAGFSYNTESCNVLMQSSVDSWKTTFGSTGSFVVDANKPLYSSFEWLNAVREKSIRSGGSRDLNVNDYNDKREVPSVLAICSWNCRLSVLADDSGVEFSDKETLKEAITALAQKTDMANALRFVSGMDTDVTNGKYLNTGANSAKGVSVITLQPTYNQINIAEGTQVENTQAGADLAYKTGNATVKTSDNYFTAAEGETVTLDITADDGYKVSAVAVTDANKTEISVEENTVGYSFKMPASSVDVTVETAEQPMHNFVLGKCIDSDCGEILDAYKWYYNATGDTYTVSTEKELTAFADLVNGGITFEGKTVSLANDITITGEWNTAIGNKENAFKGIFDGNEKTISGLNITDCTGGYKGLFGNNEGTVKNFTISGSIGKADAKITSGTDNIGGAVGYNDGTVTNVNADVTIFVKTSSIYAVGGVVGQNGTKGIISKCSNIADIEGTKCTGGICGRNYNVIEKCFNTGDITGNGGGKDSIGGITGQIGDKNGKYNTSVTNCYNTGAISNNNGRWHGGIVGMSDKAGTVLNCYNTGVIAKGYSWNWNPIIGHVDGGNNNPVAENNYSLKGLNAGDGTAATQPFTIGTIKTDEEMKAADIVSLLGAAYCMDNSGSSINNGYPVLKWQTGAAESKLKDIRIDTTDIKTDYYETDKFSIKGVKCYAVYEDGTEEIISSAPCTADKTEALTASDTEVVLTYEKDGITGTAKVSITVTANSLKELRISQAPDKLGYKVGEKFDPAGMWVMLTYANGKTELKTNVVEDDGTLAEGFEITQTPLATDAKTIEVKYSMEGKGSVSDTFDVDVVDLANEPMQDEEGRYVIKTAAELNAFSDMVGRLAMTDINVVLSADITADANFVPVGKKLGNITTGNGKTIWCSKENVYNGTFDGNGKSIELNLTGESNLALFGLAGDCTIKDLTVTGNVTGTGSGIAGIVAVSSGSAGSKIINCTNKATISGKTNVGGIVGNGGTDQVQITGCSNIGNITGSSYTGGIAGTLNYGIIENCQNSGKIQSTGNYTGGIAGSGVMNNCINTGDVEGKEYTGGIAGQYDGSDKAVSNCINKGTVKGTDRTGGIFGFSYAGKIDGCHNYGDITAAETVASYGVGGIIGRQGWYEIEMTNCYNLGGITVQAGATNVGALIGTGSSEKITVNDSYYVSECIKDADSNPISNIAGLGKVNSEDADNSKALSEQEMQGEIIKNLSEKIIELNKELANAKNISAEDIAKLEDELKTLKETYEKQLETITGQQEDVVKELNKQLEELKKQLEDLKKSQGSGTVSGGGSVIDNSLASEKAKAMKELQAMLDKSDDYYADEKAELAAAVLAGVRQIENAADKAAAQKALTEAKAKISTIKTKEQIDAEKSEIEKIKKEIKALDIKASSAKTAKGNIRIKAGVDVKAITDAGYTVEYKYYRSVKKTSGYKAIRTKDSNTYTNTTGKMGTRYYYKVRVYVYDGDNLIGSTALKQSTAASRKK